MTRDPILAHIASRSTVESNGCHVFHGASASPWNHKGIKWNGRWQTVHRVVWMATHGPIPDGLMVRHTCDNPPCVNPAHLVLGDAFDNMRDRQERGRWQPFQGEKHPMAKLSDADVDDIRRLRAEGIRVAVLAEQFGVSESHVRSIVSGRYRKKPTEWAAARRMAANPNTVKRAAAHHVEHDEMGACLGWGCLPAGETTPEPPKPRRMQEGGRCPGEHLPPEDGRWCSVCGASYHCANCGKRSSMLGHYVRGAFTCEALPVETGEKPPDEFYDMDDAMTDVWLAEHDQ